MDKIVSLEKGTKVFVEIPGQDHLLEAKFINEYFDLNKICVIFNDSGDEYLIPHNKVYMSLNLK